jgi:transketolase
MAHPLEQLAGRIRINATQMVGIQGFGYLGQALSSAEIFAALFGAGTMRPKHDRFVLSPGHYAIALYATAVEVGLLDRTQLATYGLDGSLLEAVSTERTPLVDLTCGSLSQGLSGAVGFAVASRLAGDDRRVFAFLSDGEMEEGQVWEAAMYAAHHKLDRLLVVVDANNSQVDGPVTSVTTLEPLADKWRAFGWDVADIDGHDVSAVAQAIARPENGRPRIVIARTHIAGRMRAIPETIDGHWMKVDATLRDAILTELNETLARAGV